jgi:hypothetical protein
MERRNMHVHHFRTKKLTDALNDIGYNVDYTIGLDNAIELVRQLKVPLAYSLYYLGENYAGIEDKGIKIDPMSLVADLKYSKQVQQSLGIPTTLNAKFNNDTQLKYVPSIDTSKCTNMNSAFANSQIEIIPALDYSAVTTANYFAMGSSKLKAVLGDVMEFSNCTSIPGLFTSCSNLEVIPRTIKANKATSAHSFFSGCGKLTGDITVDVPVATDAKQMFPNSGFTNVVLNAPKTTTIAKAIAAPNIKTAVLNVSSACTDFTWGSTTNSTLESLTITDCTNFTQDSYYNGFYSNLSRPNFTKCLLYNIGGNSGVTTVSFEFMDRWGADSDEARQTLIDSLITYSTDRTALGYPTATLKLHPDTHARLTENEIVQIVAKGYTIVT